MPSRPSTADCTVLIQYGQYPSNARTLYGCTRIQVWCSALGQRCSCVHPPIQIVPDILNDTHVGAIWWPIQLIDLLPPEPLHCQIRSMLQIIVLLKINRLFVDVKVTKGPKKLISLYRDVSMLPSIWQIQLKPLAVIHPQTIM